MKGKGFLVFLLVLILLLAAAYAGWFFYARWNAKRNGLPPPSPNPIAAFKNRSGGGSSNYPGPASTGIKGFIDNTMRKFKGKNDRSAAGAYEESSHETGQLRGRGVGGRLDPDEAWSARVGDEAYYEEQELGLHDHHHDDHRGASSNPYGGPTSYADTSYRGGGPAIMSPTEPVRGRSRTREDYDEHIDGGTRGNPFGDEHAASLRGVSPRPDDTSYHGGATVQMPHIPSPGGNVSAPSVHSLENSSRKSVFREDMS